MSNIIKKDVFAQPQAIQLNKGKLRSSAASPFQQRVNEARKETVDPATMPNRLALLLDDSSSMTAHEKQGTRIELLRDAVKAFVGRCNLLDTSIAVETFNRQTSFPLTSNSIILDTFMFNLQASGSTPMHRCVVDCLDKHPITRAVLVSDGEATDWNAFRDMEGDENRDVDIVLTKYKNAGIPIDCVHISNDTGGEALLRRIAEITGGLFIKFTDVSAFATAFGYLAPGLRGMLTDGRVSASDIGAKEIK